MVSYMAVTKASMLFQFFFFFSFLNNLCFWLCWVSVAAHRLSPGVVRGGHSLVAVHGHLTAAASLVGEHGLLARGLR